MCAFTKGGFKVKDHGWLQKEGWTMDIYMRDAIAMSKAHTNGLQIFIPIVSCIVKVKRNWIAYGYPTKVIL